MSLCFVTANANKDTTPNFVNRIRDSSDYTTMLRQQGTKRNYQILSSTQKGYQPIGGIPHTDLVDMAHTTQAYGPFNPLERGVGYTVPPCSPCGASSSTPYSPLKVSLSLIRY
jgi:hypothetical protein